MNSWVLALVADASATIATIRATTVSVAARSTRTVSAPVPLRVPANTSSPAVLAAGSGSPVIVAWFTSLAPDSTWPSAPIRSPGRQDQVPDRQVRGGHALLPGPGQPGRLLGGEIEQAAHRLRGAVGGDRLQR